MTVCSISSGDLKLEAVQSRREGGRDAGGGLLSDADVVFDLLDQRFVLL